RLANRDRHHFNRFMVTSGVRRRTNFTLPLRKRPLRAVAADLPVCREKAGRPPGLPARRELFDQSCFSQRASSANASSSVSDEVAARAAASFALGSTTTRKLSVPTPPSSSYTVTVRR